MGTAEEDYKRKMWEEPNIFEIKFADPKNGMSFRLGQELNIGKKYEEYTISSILRTVVDGEVTFIVYGERDGQHRILKASVGIPVYVTFEV